MTTAAPRDKRLALTLGATLGVVSVAQALLAIDTTVVAVALPTIGTEFGASAASLSWVPNAYLMALAGSMPLWGGVGDRWGRQRTLLVGLALFTAGSVMCGIAPTLPSLVVGRGIQGIGAGAIFALGLSLLTAVFPAERLGTATGVWIAATAAGMCLGPPLGAVLEVSWGWRSLFWINVPLALIALVVGFVAIPESRDPQRRSADITGGLLFLATVCLAIWGLHLVEDALLGESSFAIAAVTITMLAAVAVVLAWRERQAVDPVLAPDLLGNRVFRTLIATGFLITFSHVGVLFLETYHFQAVRGWDPLGSGLIILPLSLAIVGGGLASARLGARLGPRTVAASGLVATAMGLGLLIGLAWGLPSPAVAIANVLIGFGSGAALPIVSSSAMLSVPRDRTGTASALLNTARQFGGAVGMAVLLIAMTILVLAADLASLPVSAGEVTPTATTPPGHRIWAAAATVEGNALDVALSAACATSAVAVLIAAWLAWRTLRNRESIA